MISFGNYKKSKIVVGESYKNLLSYIPKDKRGNIVIVTDSNVGAIYKMEFPAAPVITIGVGEAVKTQETVNKIIGELIDLGADRHSYLVGIGGGVVCDITGYAASIFMRGLSFGYVSSSLLSQIDASIGGKTGVNYKGYKNIIGTFNQPDFVICDPVMLKTLPRDEVRNGIAEGIKHAVIFDKEYFNFLLENTDALLMLEEYAIEKLVARSIEIKTAVVNKDEKEKGERKKLNFGHTFGHAIETLSGMPHGQAVSIGMVKAAELSVKLGFCKDENIDRIKNLLTKFGLPVQSDISNEVLINTIYKDKKRHGSKVDFVFLKSIGEVEVIPVPIQDLNY